MMLTDEININERIICTHVFFGKISNIIVYKILLLLLTHPSKLPHVYHPALILIQPPLLLEMSVVVVIVMMKILIVPISMMTTMKQMMMIVILYTTT